ncbi:MAG: hypothetical protein A2Y12_15280 [Planctomycetes bacterium GWF2_42_9]|nr:MAG: hypothetical protein A2Y12_15280 [Planctomycetes bacterium GWF2_42_9]HAL44303.1 hypothetical protein [Phycisphaerales bacterium]
MKKKLLAILVVVLTAISANAAIVGWNCDDDGDGAIVLGGQPAFTQVGEGENTEYTISWSCVQNWFPGHVEGDFITDTELDPTVWIAETVQNQTTAAWVGYHIAIGMNKTFTISPSVIAPDYWTFIVTQPTGNQALPNNNGTGWVGYIDYYVGTGAPIAVNESGDFGFKVSFLGGVAFCTEQVPVLVPEPATMGLLTLGALALRRKK